MISLLRKRLVAALIAIILICIVAVVATGAFSVWFVLRPWNSSINYLKGTDVKTEAFDGVTLAGNLNYAETDTDRWVIIVHSYRSNKSAMSIYEEHYRASGYNTLCVDNRAHGQSEGDYIGMGYLDQFDIKVWVEYILSGNPDAEIVLHGLSMGAASCMIYSGREDAPENVIAVIDDSGYASAESYLTWKLKSVFGLPGFPSVSIANMATKVAAGYYLSDASALLGVRNSRIPTLFIHGDSDTTVPVEDCYKLYENASCEKELYIIKGSEHGRGVFDEEENYWKKIDTFLKEKWKDE